ncbi:TPA: transposase, partial [Legionella pneumophila]|nr:transposase [Legionella pneumophila]HEO1458527.1 transposase [Legionella pneumophila]
KSLFFKKNTLMTMWRYALIAFLRTKHQQGALTRAPEMGNQSMSSMLAQQYAKYWQVHCAKPHKNPKKDIEYLGRYIKRPAIANSRLVHYNGTSLLFKFLNHRTKQTQYTELHPFDFITRFIQHLPEKGFRLIRYFGFLANRLRAQLLPVVSSLFNHQPNPKQLSWPLRVKHRSGTNPLDCILCKNTMRLSFLLFKLSSRQLMNYSSQISLQKHIPIN